MTQYADLRYKDTDRLNYSEIQNRNETPEQAQERENKDAELRKQLEAGLISEAQYKTLSSTITMQKPGLVNPNAIPSYLDESSILDQLDEEDLRYLALK